ncbi:lipopolysaccharide biosynthesis protein [Salinimicrobium catena]|uniref:lipopolysaccharide biosynthesis protein n=1 Tax=Salinimicrobium catena TaxID=390640 RepID=UPI002FE4C2D0
MNVGKAILSGVFWNVLQEVISRSAGFFIKLLLARLLFPEDFGLIGMATVFISFIQVFNDIGMNAALVQRKEELLDDKHYYTSFWTGIIWSGVIYALIYFLIAPLIVDFYNEHKLLAIVRVLSLSILFSPLVSIQRAILTKRFDFKKLSFISFSTSIAAGIVAIILAFLGYGVWALVFNVVTPVILSIPLYFMATSFIPKFIWDKKAFQDIFGFGVFTTGSSLLIKVTSQMDYLLVGKLVGKISLGVYTFAFIVTEMIRAQIINVFTKVMYPIFSKDQDNTEKLKYYYLELLKVISLVIIPPMLLLIYFTTGLLTFLFGHKWDAAIPIVKIFAWAVIIHMPLVSITAMIRGSGKPKTELNFQFIRALVFYLPLIFIGTYYYGIMGTAWAHLIAKVLTVIFGIYLLNKLFGITPMEILKEVKSSLLIGLIPFAIFYIFNFPFSWYFELIIYLVVLGAAYMLFAKNTIERYIKLFRSYLKK